MDEVFFGTLVASTLRVSVPLILCALAGVLSERSGVIDLGLEGKMLLTAFATATVGVSTGSLALALAAALMFLPRLIRQFKAGLLITPEMAKALCDERRTPVIDVREARDFDGETGHVPGAINLPLGELPARIDELAS